MCPGARAENPWRSWSLKAAGDLSRLEEHVGRPYRVIFEMDDEGGVWPVAAFRIRDREFKKAR